MIKIFALYFILFSVLGFISGSISFILKRADKPLLITGFFLFVSFLLILAQLIYDLNLREERIKWDIYFYSKINAAQSTHDLDTAISNTSSAFKFLMQETKGYGLCSDSYSSKQDIRIYTEKLKETLYQLELTKEEYPRFLTDLGFFKLKELFNYPCPDLARHSSVFFRIGIDEIWLLFAVFVLLAIVITRFDVLVV